MKKFIMILCAIIIIGIGTLFIYKNNESKKIGNSNINSNTNLKVGNKPFYSRAGRVDLEEVPFVNKIINTYDEYTKLLDTYEIQYDLSESDFQNYEYYAFIIENDDCNGRIIGIEDATIENNNINILVNYEASCGICAPSSELYFVRFNKDTLKDEYKIKLDFQAINKVECDPNVSYKPVIYLYPTYDTKVTVKLGKEENLTVTYPKYNNGWNVYATSDGNLTDENGRNYYALYWEGNTYNIDNSIREGFVVKGEDSATFLEEQLEKLGLNERESNEFIMYWLPKLQNNKYNYIRFASKEEIDESMPLEITPTPDNVIRVLMLYKKLDKEITVEEQVINTPSRDGFTVVEWGGSILK